MSFEKVTNEIAKHGILEVGESDKLGRGIKHRDEEGIRDAVASSSSSVTRIWNHSKRYGIFRINQFGASGTYHRCFYASWMSCGT